MTKLLFAMLPAGAVAVLDVSAAFWLGMDPFPRFAPLCDGLIVFLFTILLLEIQARPLVAAVVSTVINLALVGAAWIKYDLLGVPPRMVDLRLLPALAETWRGGLLAVPVLLAAIATLVVNFRRPAPQALLLVLAPGLAGAVAMPQLATIYPKEQLAREQASTRHFFWFEMLGHYAGFVVDTFDHSNFAQSLARLPQGHDVADFLAAAPLGGEMRRNIHVVLVESLYDVHRFQGWRFDVDPMTPLFQRWRSLPTATLSLAPTIGSGSPNAEFEILCGSPANVDYGETVFLDLQQDLDCLPRKLSRIGYRTLATQPLQPSIFSIGNAYRRLGFGESHLGDSLDMSDLDAPWELSAQSTLEQHLTFVGQALNTGHPVFSYVMLTSGHFPFLSDTARRPHSVTVTPHESTLKDYANVQHYNMLAIEDFVAKLRQRDPDGIIAVLGDHAPPLGKRLFQTVGGASQNDWEPLLYEIPLMILDGEAFVQTGRITHYELPEVLLDLASNGTFCQTQAWAKSQPLAARYTPTGTLVYRRDGPGYRHCGPQDESADCASYRFRYAATRRQVARVMGWTWE